jgi:hypothetical protein
MADISDIEQATADVVTSALYPMGSSQPSIVGILCRIYRGWPNPSTLNADLSAGTVNITIGADNDSGRTTTRYLAKWQATRSQPGICVSTTGQTITVTGTPAVGDVVGILIEGMPFVYRVQVRDSADLVASNLNYLIQATRLSNLLGTIITIPGARSIKARVVCDSSASLESRRQEKDLRIICWCPNPGVRDEVATAIDAAIDGIQFLPLPDATDARITYRNTASYDQAQNALLYRRDLIYTVEYVTLLTSNRPSMLFGASDLNSNITYD